MRIRDWSSYVCSSDLLFAKSCYVGYTATPFANIFINPDAYGDDVREELFPRDFIYCLDAPTTYFGAEKVFLDEATSQSIVRRSEEHTSELQSLMRTSYAVFCLQNKNT